jgi:hypothetical protein
MATTASTITFPIDPLARISGTADTAYRRRTVEDVLDSYHGNYDALAEAVQNAVDAVEDAKLSGMDGPFLIEVTINLSDNSLSILDTGVGMSPDQVASAFAPHVTFKNLSPVKSKRDKKNMYRGYKGVGMTYLAYGTDDITIHSKMEDGSKTQARMQYGHAWAIGARNDVALMVEDKSASPLDSYKRGTFLRIQFSQATRPKSLVKVASTLPMWRTILRTKTAIGQVLMGRSPLVQLKAKLHVIDASTNQSEDVEAEFLYPHEIKRSPPFRFLDLVTYHKQHEEEIAPPPEKLRQDGLYLSWDAERIKKEFSDELRTEYAHQFTHHLPYLYAFVPYQGSVWSELNQIATGVSRRSYLYPGLMIAVNRQRLADISEIDATRYESFSRNVFVIVHFDDVRPDQGRKTVDIEAETFAQKAADRVVQYLAKQRPLLRPSGESPTPEQRQVEKDHQDWVFNVRTHAQTHPLHIPPSTFISTPLTEQDVVGLFHQLSALGVFPGIRIYATSQSRTYDCLVEYDCERDRPSLLYKSSDSSPLGVSPYVLGDGKKFSTKHLTMEFKNNLDGLIDDVDGEGPKTFGNIDICVCWSQVGDSFKGYQLELITEKNIDERKFPGVTHILTRDGDHHSIAVVMLKSVTDMIGAGHLSLPVTS